MGFKHGGIYENSSEKSRCDGIYVTERAIQRGVGDYDDKSIVDDTEKFLKIMTVQQWSSLRK